MKRIINCTTLVSHLEMFKGIEPWSVTYNNPVHSEHVCALTIVHCTAFSTGVENDWIVFIPIEVGYRGLFFGHSFRSSWTPDKLVTWYLLIPFSKKKLKKVRKPGCPLREMEESKKAAAMSQNWHFQPFWHFFEYFSLVKTCYFMFVMPRNPFLKDLLIFDFSFLRKGQFCSKFKRGHFSMISRILKLICC